MLKSALIVTDIQNDFCEGGSLAVPGTLSIIPLINREMRMYDTIVGLQDWHPADHVSFENLWPPHCIQNTFGAKFHPHLDIRRFSYTIQKGADSKVDSYSGFFDNDHKTKTGLHSYLQTKNIGCVFICGVALRYCVAYTALDAVQLGYVTYIIPSLCADIDSKSDSASTLNELKKAGVYIV